ncbi:hypothetical protein GIB67_007172, partial [Kingdonia uniflora]
VWLCSITTAYSWDSVFDEADKRCKWAAMDEFDKLDHIEICPKGMDLTNKIAKRIRWRSSYKSIHSSLPKLILGRQKDISIHGPISRSQFLGFLGINFRVEALQQNCTEEQGEWLRNDGYWQLVGDGEAPFWEGPDDKTPIGMGTLYMAMAIVNKKQGVSAPFQ